MARLSQRGTLDAWILANRGPSERALHAAEDVSYDATQRESEAAVVLAAAHDAALGLDRSVCLRDLVDWIRWRASTIDKTWHRERTEARAVADALEREFGAAS